MSRIPSFRRLFRFPWRTVRALEADVDEELAFHVDMRTAELAARRGLDPSAARAEALRQFGDLDDARRYMRAIDRRIETTTRRRDLMGDLRQDLRHAARGLRRRPGFTAVVVTTLALGIGANSIIFGIVDRLLLRPPARVSDPGRVTRLYIRESSREPSAPGDSMTTTVSSYPFVLALREGVPSLAEVAGMQRQVRTVGRGVAAEQVDVSLVSANFFHLLGVAPALGRFFLDEEDRPPAGADVAVLSHGFWQRHFGGGVSVVGKTLRLGDKVFTVVGVAPSGFNGVDLDKVDMWIPIGTLGTEALGQAGSFWIEAIGRIRPDATRERAGAEATLAFRRALRTWNQPWRDSAARVIAGPVVAARGPEGPPQGALVSLWLIGVAGIVLLIACANVANLLLARAVARRREIAVRLAVGISRGRLIRHLVAESALLTMLSGASALLIAHWGGQIVRTVLVPGITWSGSPVDRRVLLFTMAAAACTAMLTGLAPALQGMRVDVTSALKSGARSLVGGRSALRDTLLVAQVTLSIVLLIGAGVFVRSLRNVRSLDIGLDAGRVLRLSMNFSDRDFTPARVREMYAQAQERVRRVPGVQSAALVAGSVPKASARPLHVHIPGRSALPHLPGGLPYYSAVSSSFFSTLGARIIRGRGFVEADETAHARVAVVNETLARHYWPREDPIGSCVIVGQDKACTEIIGESEDVVFFRMIDDPHAQIYLPVTHPYVVDEVPAALVIRASSDPSALPAMLRRDVSSLAADMPYVDVSRFDELIAPEVQPWRLGASMFGVFGLLALVIAAIGLYSSIAYSVAQRTHEIGVRMALGARRADVVRLILGGAVRTVAIGTAAGFVIALGGGERLAPLLFHTSPRDPAIFAVVALALLAVAIVASAFPAWRATQLNPVDSLRAD